MIRAVSPPGLRRPCAVSGPLPRPRDPAATSWTMVPLRHQAIRAAVASKTNWPTVDKIAGLNRSSKEEVTKWRETKLHLEKGALDIYEPCA